MNHNIVKDEHDFHVDPPVLQGFSRPGMYDKKDTSALSQMAPQDAIDLREIFFELTKTREDVLSLEQFIKDLPTSFTECPYPLFHTFAGGMYSREIHLNKGDLIVGAIHRNEYIIHVLKGKIWITSEFGAKEIEAPCSFVAKAGVKHIGFTLEDTVWTDTHRVESDNIEDAEKELFVDSYEDLDKHNNIIKTEFSKMCDDLGYSEEEVRKISEINIDLIPQPLSDPVEIMDSDIEGSGIFVTENIAKGYAIGMARLRNCRTPVGRYTNHSDTPNAKCMITKEMLFFVAAEDLIKGAEVTVDYRNVREQALMLDGGTLCQQ